MAKLINGRRLALSIRKELAGKIKSFSSPPGLAIILVGKDPGSAIYVSLKEAAARRAGIFFAKHCYPESASEEDIIELINKLNQDRKINGILVQLPLPPSLSTEKIINAIDPVKDVDGFHPDNIRALLADEPVIVPGLAQGIFKLVSSTGVALPGLTAVILANSLIFAEPLRYFLEKASVQVAVCLPGNSQCDNLIAKSGLVIAAVGRPNSVRGGMIRRGAIVIDVGYNRLGKRAVGDVDFDSVSKKAAWISPVPGGVGPMTVAELLNNVVHAYEIQNKIKL